MFYRDVNANEFNEARQERGSDFRHFNQNEAAIERQAQAHADRPVARLARLAKFAAEIARQEG